jgi:tetratricopeptide (TPR) repeat protein
MFFPRLRRQAKWMFLFLAIAMGGGFVLFGVGAGGIGLGNVISGSGDSGVPSVSEAEKEASENPSDPQAFRELATAHQAAADTDGAIEALERVVLLRPKSADDLRQLAVLYLAKADEAQARASEANLRAAYLAPGTTVASSITIDGKPLEPDAISNALSARLTTLVSTELGAAQQAYASAVTTYKKIVAARPRDPSVLLELGQAAQSANDTTSAIEAYEKFIRLAPTDPTVPEVERLLKELRAFSTPSG